MSQAMTKACNCGRFPRERSARATQQSMRRVRRVRRARARCSSVLGERAGWRETRRGNRATGWAGGHARARVARRAPATFGWVCANLATSSRSTISAI